MPLIPHKKVSQLVKIPSSIWALGLVSLFMDASSELIHSLLPLFMVTTLGTSVVLVGVIEGAAEALALMTRVFSGALSDYLGRRKLFTMIGYGVAALSKPLFPLANGIGIVFAARLMDRMGKGIRGAPRDALIGDLAPSEIRGACFGLRQSLDTVGAFLGPFIALCGMLLFSDNIRAVLWIAVLPAFISVLILALFVKEPSIEREKKGETFHPREIRTAPKVYFKLVALAGVFMLARFSEAFLILKAQSMGLPLALTPLVLVLMNVVYAFGAYPAGILSDKVNRKTVLLIGIALLIVSDLVIGFATHLLLLALGIGLWGLHMAFTQGVFAAMVTDTTPQKLRGTAYGVFDLVSGVAVLLSSLIAGVLWDSAGSSTTFFVGAFFAAIALLGFMIVQVSPRQEENL